ncbi:hypothetical protein [Nocardioides pakistanensis]
MSDQPQPTRDDRAVDAQAVIDSLARQIAGHAVSIAHLEAQAAALRAENQQLRDTLVAVQDNPPAT